MVWILTQHDNAVIKEIERQRDRAAALIAAACLEERLADVLLAAFEVHPTVSNKVFKGYGPLATFSAKIDLGLLLGLYPEHLHKDMFLIKDIRNEFAHNPKPINFKSQRIFDLCSKLSPPPKRKKPPFAKEITRELIDKLMTEEIKLVPVAFGLAAAGRDTARNRYMYTVKGCLLLFSMLRNIIELKRKLRKQEPEERDYWPWPLLGRSSPPPPPAPRIGSRIRRKQ